MRRIGNLNCGRCGAKLIVISSEFGVVVYCPICRPKVEEAFMKGG